MSQHSVQIDWVLKGTEFNYDTYNRDHTWRFDNGLVMRSSATPEFKGDIDCVDPEEALTASVSSCHMLTFLAICAKKHITVLSYTDNAVATLEKNSDNKLAITTVGLSPVIKFAQEVDSDTLAKLHASAHENCFIANSIKAKVYIQSEE